jgi:hypothetical protein
MPRFSKVPRTGEKVSGTPVRDEFGSALIKNSLTHLRNFITHQSLQREMLIFSNNSQKISVTRYCGRKGGIIDGD